MACLLGSKQEARREATAAARACLGAFALRAEVPLRSLAPLGCGRQGCAYRAGVGRVLKITCDRGEAELGALFEAAGSSLPRALPRVYGAWRLQCAGEKKWYALWREELGPVPRNRRFVGVLLANALGNPAQNADVVLSQLRGTSGRDATEQRNIENAIATIDWAVHERIAIRDLHHGNWGWRWEPGEIVARDLGFGFASSERHPGVLALALGVATRTERRARGLDPVGV